MTPTDPSTTPPHLAEPIFRSYEPFIARAVAAWPSETEFTKADMRELSASGGSVSPNTFAARLRDAIASVKKYRWSPTSVDVQKLVTISTASVVAIEVPQKLGTGSSEGASVWFKHRGKKGRPYTGAGEARREGFAVDADVVRTPWQEPTYAEVRAVCILLHHGRLTGPIIVTGQVNTSSVEELEGRYNVALVFDDVNNRTVIT